MKNIISEDDKFLLNLAFNENYIKEYLVYKFVAYTSSLKKFSNFITYINRSEFNILAKDFSNLYHNYNFTRIPEHQLFDLFKSINYIDLKKLYIAYSPVQNTKDIVFLDDETKFSYLKYLFSIFGKTEKQKALLCFTLDRFITSNYILWEDFVKNIKKDYTYRSLANSKKFFPEEFKNLRGRDILYKEAKILQNFAFNTPVIKQKITVLDRLPTVTIY